MPLLTRSRYRSSRYLETAAEQRLAPLYNPSGPKSFLAIAAAVLLSSEYKSVGIEVVLDVGICLATPRTIVVARKVIVTSQHQQVE